jgi:hypothetical protein
MGLARDSQGEVPKKIKPLVKLSGNQETHIFGQAL